MRLASAFGTAALLLSLIGIYGVVSYNVIQRRTELGLRLALGSKRSELLALVLRRGFRPVLLGLGSGLLLSLSLGQFARSLLFGVTSVDPFTIAAVTLILLLTALLACFLPAQAAVRMNPATILHYE